MTDQRDHRGCVDAWLARGARGLPPDALIRAFDGAFLVLWRRAHRTLGDVTLMAIAARVLCVAAERYPTLSALELETTGLRTDTLQSSAASLPVSQLEQALCFVLEEFLTVLGNLTAQILTPALHQELSKLSPQEAAAVSSASRSTPLPASSKRRQDIDS